MKNEVEKTSQSKEILLAAFKCISAKGYANVSLRDIADEAGVVLSQLSYYYKNKEGLFAEVIKMLMQKYLMEVENCLQKGATANEKTLSLVKYFQEMLVERPEIFKLLHDFTNMAIWSVSSRKLLRSLFKDLSNLIEQHIFSNVAVIDNLKGYPPKSMARMLLGTVFGIAIQVILDPGGEDLSDSLNAIQVVFN